MEQMIRFIYVKILKYPHKYYYKLSNYTDKYNNFITKYSTRNKYGNDR